MPFTKEQIREKAFQLESAGAPPEDIESFVSLASQDLVENVAPQGSILRKLLPTKQELPEFLLSMAGGLKRSTPLGIALSGAGAGVGEAIRQAIFEKEPLTIKERAQKIGFAGLRGAAGETIGRGIGKLLRPFSGGVTPEIEAGVKAVKEEGIVPPLSARTESKFVQGMERFAEVSPFGTGISKQKKQALEQFSEFSKRVGSEIAVDRPPEVTGNLVKETLSGFLEKFGETTDKLYETVMPVIREAKPKPELKSTISVLQNIIKRRASAVEPSGLNQLRSLLKDIGGEKESLALLTGGKEGIIKTFDDLKQLRTNIGLRTRFDDPAVSGLQKDLKELYGAITEDLNSTVKKVSESAYNDLQTASQAFKEGEQIIKSTLFNQMTKAKPENIYKFIIQPNSPSQAKLGKELLGEDMFNEVKRQWFDDLLDKSSKIIEGEKILSPQKLSTNIKKVGSTIEEIFDEPKQLEKFKKLEQIANLLSRGKEITSGSQTAFLMQGVRGIMNILAAPIVKSEVGKEFLTRGFPKSSFVVERSVQPITQLGLQKASE